MVVRERKTNHDLEAEEQKWLQFGKFQLILLMAALFFALAQNMVNHHFFTGGELNNRAAAVGP